MKNQIGKLIRHLDQPGMVLVQIEKSVSNFRSFPILMVISHLLYAPAALGQQGDSEVIDPNRFSDQQRPVVEAGSRLREAGKKAQSAYLESSAGVASARQRFESDPTAENGERLDHAIAGALATRASVEKDYASACDTFHKELGAYRNEFVRHGEELKAALESAERGLHETTVRQGMMNAKIRQMSELIGPLLADDKSRLPADLENEVLLYCEHARSLSNQVSREQWASEDYRRMANAMKGLLDGIDRVSDEAGLARERASLRRSELADLAGNHKARIMHKQVLDDAKAVFDVLPSLEHDGSNEDLESLGFDASSVAPPSTPRSERERKERLRSALQNTLSSAISVEKPVKQDIPEHHESH